jgi:O-antigen ligase
MLIEALQSRSRIAGLWAWGLMLFCLPFSTALTLLFSTLGLLLALIGFDLKAFKRAISHPISVFCLALFFWLALSTFWSVAPSADLVEGISKYRKLLYVPFVAMLLFSNKKNVWFVTKFFAMGCLVVCVGSFASFSGVLEHLIGPQLPDGGWGLGGTPTKHWFYIGPPESPTFGRAYIAQGAFLVIAAMMVIGRLLSLNHSELGDSRKVHQVVLVGLAFAFVATTFNLGGRTGYLLAILGAALWVAHLGSKKGSRFALKWFSMALSGLIVLMLIHPTVNARILQAYNSIVAYKVTGSTEDQGTRLSYWMSGIRNGLDRPILGWGVGSFAEVYSNDMKEPLELRSRRPHPHSEYVLQFVQGGFVGLGLLMGILFYVTRELRILNNPFKITNGATLNKSGSTGLAIGLFLLLVDGLFNSVIWDLGEAHLFVVLAALFIYETEKSRAGDPEGEVEGKLT